jgi:Glu-tRNA(Gln) amidotransferase subunit E-like FAD-binding protein
LVSVCKGEKVDYSKYAPLSEADLEKEIKEILAQSSELEFKVVIGKVMGSLKGRAEGKKIMEMLKKLHG